MKKLIFILLFFTSCSTYNLSTDYRIKSILTITEKGDTLAVPVREFKFRILDQRKPFRYEYRQDWQRWNWYNYNSLNINTRPFFRSVTNPIRSVKPPSSGIVIPINIPRPIKPPKKVYKIKSLGQQLKKN